MMPVSEETLDEVERALEFYADPDHWRMNGPLDPSSPNFSYGRAANALARLRAERGTP